MSDSDGTRRGYTIPLARDELVFNLTTGLDKARHMWPRRRADQENPRMTRIAERVANHLELCNVRCYRRPSAPVQRMAPIAPWRGPRPEHARLIREEQRMLDARSGDQLSASAPEDGGTPPTTEVLPTADGTTPTGSPRSTRP